MEMMINYRYVFESEINRGAFGIIYRGIDKRSQEKVAIKIELPHSPASLKYEVKILTYLKTNKIKRVPEIFWYGFYNRVPCLVMTYYNSSLYDYFQRSNVKICIDIIYNWMYQIVEIIETFHKVFLLHRDIKPQNIMIKGSSIYFIDFGLSTFYIGADREHTKDYEDISQEKEDRIIGSLKFASIFLHQGHHYSRRDDFISAVYIFAYLLLGGQTPWFHRDMKITEQNKTKDIFMTILNENSKENDLTMFRYFLEYCYQLSYDETPNYESMKQLFFNRC